MKNNVNSNVNSNVNNQESSIRSVEVVIVGAGFGGLCAGIQLQKAGINDFVILEKAEAVGGTWRDNTYPGAACDVQSHLYSYSFEGNPDWSTRYSGWQEIQQYIHHVTDKYNLHDHIQYRQEVTAATFDEGSGRWLLTVKSGERYSARYFVLATGPLHVPNIPKLPGLDDFAGKVIHSAQWDHEYALAGKRVVSVGTGASAIQYVPEIAQQAEHLTVFQRTPAWVIPRDTRAYSATEKNLFRRFSWLRRLHRSRLYVSNEIRVLPMLHGNIARYIEPLVKAYIRYQVKDPVLRQKLTPDYLIGCKRVLISSQYYRTFNRDNVALVTEGIQRIGTDGVYDKEGNHYPADALVLGTGFVTDPRAYMKDFVLTGLGGKDLRDAWSEKAEAYYGVSVSGFPNLFQLLGPNTTLGHNSVILMIEHQVEHIVRCIKEAQQRSARYLDLQPDVQHAFNIALQSKLEGTAWQSGCQSWYHADGHNVVLWPGTVWGFRKGLQGVDLDVYRWVS